MKKKNTKKQEKKKPIESVLDEQKKNTGTLHRIERLVSAILPCCVLNYLNVLIIESDENIDLRDYVIMKTLYSIAVGIFIFIISQIFIDTILSIVFGIIICFTLIIWSVLRLVLKANQRAKDIERDLPEILQMISANMRAGMTVEKAVTETVWPEFGILGKEINKIKIRLHTGKSFSQAFEEMSKTVRSETLKRSVKLLIEGNKLGGEMALLVYDISKNLKETRELKEQIKSATTAYTIFILLGAIIITPVLFSISVEYSTFTEQISEGGMGSGISNTNTLDTSSSAGISSIISLMGEEKEVVFDKKNIELFSLICITIIAISSSFILATIRAERTISGIKYVPLALGVSFAIYFVSRIALGFVMGSLVTGIF